MVMVKLTYWNLYIIYLPEDLIELTARMKLLSGAVIIL